MSTVTFHPSVLSGSGVVPPAKSEAHRALLLAALSDAPCRLTGFTLPLCDDVQAMIAGVRGLGAQVDIHSDSLFVTPAPKKPSQTAAQVYVHACAAALRMLIPAYLVRGQKVIFTMEDALFRRPQTAYDALISSIGGSIRRIEGKKGEKGERGERGERGEKCRIEVEGFMPAGEYEIDGSQSSQFASGLLIALSHSADESGVPAPSTLRITGKMVSRPYLDMTLSKMQLFSLPYEEKTPGQFLLSPAPETCAETRQCAVEGDWSQAAVFLCMNALGNPISVPGLFEKSVQGDKAVVDVLQKTGLQKSSGADGLGLTLPPAGSLRPAVVDCSNIPDIAPILALALSRADGESVLTGVNRLTIKESDRLQATVDTLAQLGTATMVEDNRDVLHIYGGSPLKGGFEADARGDHRLVMLLAAAATAADGPITVHGAQAITKSWPGFFETYKSLGGILS